LRFFFCITYYSKENTFYKFEGKWNSIKLKLLKKFFNAIIIIEENQTKMNNSSQKDINRQITVEAT
jgi:hypothetical protein